jgi:hypothetical protein
LRDDRHRSGRKTLAQRAKSGDLEVKRQATWGMSVKILATEYRNVPENYERPLIANQICSETNRADIFFDASLYHTKPL